MEMKQKVISATNTLTNETDYYKPSQTKEKRKWDQHNQIKENKNSFERRFKPMWQQRCKTFFFAWWHEIKTWRGSIIFNCCNNVTKGFKAIFLRLSTNYVKKDAQMTSFLAKSHLQGPLTGVPRKWLFLKFRNIVRL